MEGKIFRQNVDANLALLDGSPVCEPVELNPEPPLESFVKSGDDEYAITFHDPSHPVFGVGEKDALLFVIGPDEEEETIVSPD